MARATRSSVLAATTKRKRHDADDDDNGDNDNNDDNPQPPKKLSRHDPPQPSPIPADHAAAVLDVLEMTDTHGLLDRVFPVLDHPETSSSLRALLSDPRPLPVLRAAVQHLFPVSSLPRAKPSPIAAQQLRFCNLAVSLLDQSSKHTTPIPLSLDSILPPNPEPSEPRPLKYALVQHLPNQDYWTSLNSDAALTSALRRLPSAHSELVAIFPTPASTSKKPVPTLGSYVSTRPLASVKPLPAQRSVTTGSFLDYGPWSSFAPSFDHNAEVVGRRELGLALYASHEKRQKRLVALTEAREGRGSIEEVFSDLLTAPEEVEPEREGESHIVDLDEELQELLPPEEVASIKAALGSLELENAVQELLERNRGALVRLEELQITRLIREGEHSKAEEGSEEWDTAQGIMDSLAVLASLRPRVSSKTAEEIPASIVPPPAVLHRLHRTLALEPTQGWYGTLPDTITTRPMALRDDTTVKKSRSGPLPTSTPTPAAAAPVATPATTTTAPVPVATPVAMPYTGYPYAYGAAAQQAQVPQQQQQQPYRPANGTAVATTQQQAQYTQYTPQYYSYAAPPPQQAQMQGAVPMQQSYYGQQQQGYAAAAYSGWYNAAAAAYQQQAQGQGPVSGSGPGTPQPQGTATYGSFFGGARTPAVANTVYAPVGTGQGTPSSVMPPHLRSGPGGQQGYYPPAAYQQPPAASPGIGR